MYPVIGLPPFAGACQDTLTPFPFAGLTVGAAGAAGAVAVDGALIARLTSVEWLIVPLWPPIVTEYVPGAVVDVVAIVSVEPDEVGFGEKLPLAPLGRPLTLSVTGPAPFVGDTVTP